MTLVTRLNPSVPIGRLPDGTPVTIDQNWYRYMTGDVYQRIGGETAATNNEVDEFLQFDVREADGGELGKRIDSLQTLVSLSPSPEALIGPLRQLIADLQEVADSLSTVHAAQAGELAKRCAGIEVLQAFTK